MLRSHPRDWLVAALAGIVYSLTFAPGPLPQWLLPAVQLVVLAWLARTTFSSPNAQHAAWRGWFFGLGTFSVGLYWLTISMSRYGGMPWVLAIAALLLLSAYLALFPALALWLTRRLSTPPSTLSFMLLWASAWTLTEWLRGTLFTGFPWLNMSYGQIDSWLSGWSTVAGSYGVVWATAFVAAALMVTFNVHTSRISGTSLTSETSPSTSNTTSTRLIKQAPLLLAFAVIIMGALLGSIPFSKPFGDPIRVRLIQGNIDQGEKFTPIQWRSSVQRYLDLAQHKQPNQTLTPQLIMMPETMMVRFPQEIEPSVWQSLITVAQRDHATILLGTPLFDSQTRQYTNSVIALTGHETPASVMSSQVARYDKQHLVPFGEFVPVGFRWFVDLMHIPLGNFASGVSPQQPFEVGQQRIAANICYEDIFGEELLAPIRGANSSQHGATILANFSNLGWFGDTWALRQHWQMARLRAIETSRPIVRATNTGLTGAIDDKGRTVAFLRPMQGAYLDVSVQGHMGLTPYTQWGNQPLLIWVGLIVLVCGFKYYRLNSKQHRQQHDHTT